jgi:hypothetical protein
MYPFESGLEKMQHFEEIRSVLKQNWPILLFHNETALEAHCSYIDFLETTGRRLPNFTADNKRIHDEQVSMMRESYQYNALQLRAIRLVMAMIISGNISPQSQAGHSKLN